ncbi:MAG: glycerol kinase GlpK [Acidimicrobiia bacterium]|nr:MAG: glycerol kinase GlpK [Acidimicrobiia bacterium]
MGRYIGAIDQGTTSSRFVIVDAEGSFVSMAQTEHEQVLPRPGWVEHDPGEILRNTIAVISEALDLAGIRARDLAGVAITNQRETTVVWDRDTGESVANAIVWQDTRTADLTKSLVSNYGAEAFRAKTGLPPATYFSGPKVRWILDQNPDLERRAHDGQLAFGTIDSWLAWHLTGRHVTDVTNASRTMLMDLESLSWDEELQDALGVPGSMLPEIVPSIGDIAPCAGVLEGTRLTTILGDQHAALVGQAAFDVGDTKVTYGTGAFLVSNTGTEIVQSNSGLLTTVAYQIAGEPAKYALEGSVAVAGSAVQWLRDNIGLIAGAEEIEPLASTVPDNGDVYFVPAFSGLFAPRWRDDARGVLAGLTRYSNKGHLARAVLEATAFQTKDVLDAMVADTGRELSELRVDGGMVGNSLLMGFQADILGIDVVVPSITETTVLGAAFGAGMAAGVWSDTDDVSHRWREAVRYRPSMESEMRDRLLRGWAKAIERSLGWVET